MEFVSKKYFIILIFCFILITIATVIAKSKNYGKIDKHSRLVSIGLLFERIKEFQVTHSKSKNQQPDKLSPGMVTPFFPRVENIYNKNNNPIISWRYCALHYVDSYIVLDTSQSFDSIRNQYLCQLAFLGLSENQVLREDNKNDDKNIIGTIDNIIKKKEKNIVYPFCYEYSESHYQSMLDEKTNILTISGKGTAFDPDVLNKGWNSLPDDLLVFIEVHSDIHWTEPFDIDVESLLLNEPSPRYELGLTSDKDGFFVCFLDGSVWYLKKNIPLELLGKLATVDSARENDRDELLKEYVLEK